MIKRVNSRKGYFKGNELIKCCKLLFCTLLFALLFTSCKKVIEKEPIKNQSGSKNTESELIDNPEVVENDNSKPIVKDTNDTIDPKSESEPQQEDSINTNNDMETTTAKVVNIINPEGRTIKERFEVLEGYERQITEVDTFAYYLQNLPLKPDGTKVKYYDGRTKNKNVYLAVVDLSLGDRDLQQCADVVIRLRAEYLYEQNKPDEIHFNFVSGFRAEFSKWVSGKGISVKGNTVSWTYNPNNNDSYESFQKYLDMVYAYASTLSLDKELNEKSFEDIMIGDVFIQAGSPGHCVIVVDMAVNKMTGEKIVMLAQGYMPAQDIQILIGDKGDSPWFTTNIEEKLRTPEWVFETTDLKTWE